MASRQACASRSFLAAPLPPLALAVGLDAFVLFSVMSTSARSFDRSLLEESELRAEMGPSSTIAHSKSSSA